MANFTPNLNQVLETALQHHLAGRLPQAEALYRQILQQNPQHAEALHLLGMVAAQAGQTDAAVNLIRYAIALQPKFPPAFSNLGNILRDQGKLDEAVAALRQAIALLPNFPEAYNNLGIALREQGRLEASTAALRQAVDLNPNFPEAHNNLAVTLKDQGQLDEAIAAHRRALALKPDYSEAHSNLVYLLQFHPAYDAPAIAGELRDWNRRHAEPLANCIPPHANPRDPDRRLRIGYVSPDFRQHVVGRNVLPLFHHHDQTQFELYCYADLLAPDPLTEEFRRHAGTFRLVSRTTHEALAALIRDDHIDVLVDLTLHMADNRLLVFARKPAPVQVTFAGYPGSTGLTAIDYRLSDPYLDPPDVDPALYSEQTLRLPHTFWCYDPLENRDLPVNPLPALTAGIVTFGCLNNFCKINDPVLALWANVLRQVAGSRLILMAPAGSHRARTWERFQQEGIDAARVEFVPYQPRRQYLQEYHRIDIGLDTFPYNGHTTSLESLWMGVPVVTRVGHTVVARAGWSQLSNLGLPELAGSTPDDFVRIAVALAQDLPRLRDLRAALRPRMEQSPLMEAPRFARHIETAYRHMWRKWCAPAP
jgi:protein O-GlcNAc transferase